MTIDLWKTASLDLQKSCEEHEAVLLCTHQGIFAGSSIAEKLDIPFCWLSFAPWEPTVDYQCYVVGVDDVDEVTAFKTHVNVHDQSWMAYAGFLKDVRSDLGLTPMPVFAANWIRDREGIPFIQGYSPQVFYPSDWKDNENIHVVGYLLNQEGIIYVFC